MRSTLSDNVMELATRIGQKMNSLPGIDRRVTELETGQIQQDEELTRVRQAADAARAYADTLLPAQEGQEGKYLQTDGERLRWIREENPVFGTVKSGGTADATGFKLADDTDLAELFGKISDVANETSGEGAAIKDVSLSLEGKNVKLTKTLGAASYCSYCSHCSHCSHCTYCKYCGIACGD